MKHLLCFRDHPLKDAARRRDIMYQAYCFSSYHGSNVKVANRFSRRVFGSDRIHILQELKLTTGPPTDMIIYQAASRERRRPNDLTRDVKYESSYRVAAGSSTDPPLCFVRGI